jgi:hypothetical protein
MVPTRTWFPTDTWLADMKTAVAEITAIGSSILEAHREASARAAANAEDWHLVERLDRTREAMHCNVNSLRQIIESIENCRHAIYAEHPVEAEIHEAANFCSNTIEQRLPAIEDGLVTIRQSVLDLLQWTQRSGRLDESELPEQYRASFAKLIAHSPTFKPLMTSFQEDLLKLNESSSLHPDIQRLISLITRFNAVADSTRGFIGSIVKPPLELVFHETESFLSDLQKLSTGGKTRAATALNDCCQLLLYDPAEFRRRVTPVQPKLAEGVDSTLVVLNVCDDFRVIFTVDEDPVFKQLVATLFHILPVHDVADATDNLTRTLYDDFTAD